MSPDEFHLFLTYSYLFGNKHVKSKLNISRVFLMKRNSAPTERRKSTRTRSVLHRKLTKQDYTQTEAKMDTDEVSVALEAHETELRTV